MSQLCPCGSAVEYSLCCYRYVSGAQVAPTPSHLMRSRYCAFVMKDADYLIKTRHPDCHAAAFRDDIIAGFTHTEWLGLTVLSNTRQIQKILATSVLSRGFLNRENWRNYRTLSFFKENGQWYYIDGTRPQIGRNDACPCGSGKKNLRSAAANQRPTVSILQTFSIGSPLQMHSLQRKVLRTICPDQKV